MKQEDIIKALEAIKGSGINVKGDLVLEKHVDYEVANVEQGGIGIQINHAKNAPQTSTDRNIKAAIESLLSKTDCRGKLLFQTKKQWWAVYRVLSTFCNYPVKMTSFVAKITDMEVDYSGNPNLITYDSLVAASKDVPQMATCSPSAWHTLKDISDNYSGQYVVAEFIMKELAIKS